MLSLQTIDELIDLLMDDATRLKVDMNIWGSRAKLLQVIESKFINLNRGAGEASMEQHAVVCVMAAWRHGVGRRKYKHLQVATTVQQQLLGIYLLQP